MVLYYSHKNNVPELFQKNSALSELKGLRHAPGDEACHFGFIVGDPMAIM